MWSDMFFLPAKEGTACPFLSLSSFSEGQAAALDSGNLQLNSGKREEKRPIFVRRHFFLDFCLTATIPCCKIILAK